MRGVSAVADYLATGIDISEFNGDVNIAGLKGKVDFIIIRCGFGGDYSFQDDAQYRANVRKCQAAGIPFGVYLYSYARNVDMAKSEARHTLRLLRELGGAVPLYGVWYDVEDATLPSGEVLVDNCLAYYEMIEAAGYYCGLYSYLVMMKTKLNSPRLSHIDRWVAQWSGQLAYPGAGMWQYTDRGVINGKIFDMNRAYRDYPAIISKEDETDMTRDEVAALARQEAQKIYDENEKRYRRFENLPGWAREAVEDVYERLDLLGTGKVGAEVEINASYTYARALVVIDKLMDALEKLEKAEGAE